MGILDKLSEIRRKSVDEDWRETAREYNKAKKVQDFHEARQNALNYNLKTKYGDWDVKIKFESSYGDSDIKVTVENDKDYVGSKWFKTGKEVKDYLFDGGLRAVAFKHIREKLVNTLNHDTVTPEQMKEVMAKADKMIDSLQDAIDIKIDEEDIDRKLHRYTVYTNAMKARSSKRNDLRWKASREYEKERKLEIGDVVYGNGNSDLRSGKAYVIKDIKNVSWTKDPIYVVEPENGRGRSYEEKGKNLYRSSDEVAQAVENPDDPKYDKGFDQQEYMMNRYAGGDDSEFNEAVKLLQDQGMIVEGLDK
jgi:hypothetical protein